MYSSTHVIYFLQNFNFCIDIESWGLLKESNITLGKTVLFWNKTDQKEEMGPEEPLFHVPCYFR